METDQYRFELIKDNQFVDLIPLFNSAYGSAPSLKEIKNKYSTKAFLQNNCGVICYFEDKAVAYVGAIPCFLERKGDVIKGAQIGDVMTHSDHLRFGLFHKAGKILFDYLRKQSVDVIFGFPNLKSKPGFKKRLNWTFTDDLKVTIIDVKCLPFLRIKKLIPPLSKLIDNYQYNFLKRKTVSPKPFKSSLGDEFYEVQKDEHYIAYKLNHKDSLFISLLGKIIWVKLDSMYLYVGNVEECSQQEFNQIIGRLKKICRAVGVPHIRMQVSGGSQLKRYLDQVSKEDQKTFAVGGLIYKPGLSFEELKFTMSDNDTF